MKIIAVKRVVEMVTVTLATIDKALVAQSKVANGRFSNSILYKPLEPGWENHDFANSCQRN